MEEGKRIVTHFADRRTAAEAAKGFRVTKHPMGRVFWLPASSQGSLSQKAAMSSRDSGHLVE